MNNDVNIGSLCDEAIFSGDLNQIDEHINLCQKYLGECDDQMIKKSLCYYLGNLYSEKSKLLKEDCDAGWRTNNMPFNMVSALNYSRRSNLDILEIRVNLGSALNSFARFYEALSYWDVPLTQHTSEAAYVSAYVKGKNLVWYSRYLNDERHVLEFQYEAYRHFKWLRNYIKHCDHAELTTIFNSDDAVQHFLAHGDVNCPDIPPLDKVAKKPKYAVPEREYRRWCRKNRLFLNPLNDISIAWSVDHDVLQFPTYSTSLEFIAPYHAECFSNMKRDYCFARHMLYEGIHEKHPKYEEKGLYLVDAELVSYSGATEKIKTALRIAFSIFDSLERLMQYYFIPDKAGMDTKFNGKQIRERYAHIQNPFIGSLYWVACDLTDDEEIKGDWLAPEPSSKDIRRVRNAVEHGWLRVSEYYDKKLYDADFAMMISRDNLDDMAMRVLRLSRAALMYFTFAVRFNELLKQKSDHLTLSQPMPIWNPNNKLDI